jgi:hypothetical protein
MTDNILFKTAMPFMAIMLLTMIVAFRRHDQKCRHRSFIQWSIYLMRRLSLFLWAVVSGLDAGYLNYRQVLASYKEPLENEEALGLLLGAKSSQEIFCARPMVINNLLAR